MGILRILKLKKEYARISALSSEEVQEIQQENIASIVEHAYNSSPFYRSLYEGYDLSDFSSLPFTNKEIIMDNLDDVFTSPNLTREGLEHYLTTAPPGERYLGEYTVVHTSGSSGDIGIFAYDSLAWDSLKAMLLARVTDFEIKIPRKRLAFVGLTGGHYAGVTLASDVPSVMAAYEHVSVVEPVATIVERLNEFQPDDLRGYPSGLSILATEQLAGRLDITPNNIVSSAEPLDAKTRILLEDAFGLTPFNFYAASEAIGVAQDCSEHDGLHVFSDQVVIEIVDDDGNPVEPGEQGHVVLTNLFNKCQPLIRYQMNDIAAYAVGECSCGSPFPRLETISGRKEETIWVENASGLYEPLHPVMFGEFFVPGLKKLQVEQKERNSLVLYAVADEQVLPLIVEKMNEVLDSKSLRGVVDFDVEFTDSIRPDPLTGKTKTVISTLGEPEY